jgi:D-amino peptidase
MRRRTALLCPAVLCLVAVSAAGCAVTVDSNDGARSSRRGRRAAEPWTTRSADIDRGDGLSVLVLHDMEGLSGQDDWRTFSFSHPEHYARGQAMLVADVNAVVDGLFAGGATEVHVVDGHGSGNPEPDIRSDLLDPRATQVFRDAPFDTYFDIPESSHYDAVAVVGMHAKTGSAGFASHTFTLGIEFQVNGQAITETELVALSWGRFGVPVIFASGDDRLAADLATMPWIESVTVKTATSASTVDLRPVDEAHADLSAAAARAVANLDNAQVMQAQLPVMGTLRAVPPASLASLAGVPNVGYDVDSNSVTFEAETLREMYDGLVALVTVARAGYSSVLAEQIDALGHAGEVGPAYRDALFTRWLDFESGRWTAPGPSTAGELQRGHGYR